jgi:hypothetical protein
MLSSHNDTGSVVSSQASEFTVHSGHGRYEDAHLFSLEKLIDDAEAGDESAMKRLRRRRKYELKLVSKYNRYFVIYSVQSYWYYPIEYYRTEIENRADDCWFLLDSRWLNRWYAFVKGGENTPPGPITSRDLLDENNDPLPGLRSKIDYRGVAPMVFYVLVELHGRDNSPELCRYEVDIYSKPLTSDRIIKVAHKAVVEARIQVSKYRPKWLKWEREYPEDEEDEALGCCCGLTKEHLEAFIYWMVACWSRRSSGREKISYRQYQPLRGQDDDPSNHAGNLSNDTQLREGSSRGPGRLSMEMSQHGNSRHGMNGSSKHGGSSSQHGNTSQPGSRAGSVHGGLNSRSSSHGNDEEEWVWGEVQNPLNSSRHSSIRGPASVGEEEDENGADDTDSDSDESAQGLQIAPADVGHESGTWLRFG